MTMTDPVSRVWGARPRGARRVALRALAVCSIATAACAANAAQPGSGIEPTTARWAIVDDDAVTVRCGDLDRYYAVATIEPGTLLTIDGESDGWLRVRYPQDVLPLVPIEDARALGDGRVELIRKSGLRAPSLMMGLAGSWKSVYDPPLDRGVRLDVVETIASPTGETLGWRVVAPEPPIAPSYARGFVRRDGIRNARAAEVEAFLATLGTDAPEQAVAIDTHAPDATDIIGDAAERADAGTQTLADAANQAAADSREQGETTRGETTMVSGVDTSLLEPMNPDAPLADPATTNPAATDQPFDIVGEVSTPGAGEKEPGPIDIFAVDPADLPGDAAPGDAVPVIEQGGDAGVFDADAIANDDSLGLSPAAFQDLEATFQSARKLPRAELDVALDELLAEYTRARGATEQPAVQRALDQRIEWFNLRIATRDERKRLESVLREVDQREVELRQRVQEWRGSRAFTIVGRVARSRVYDGERLPLMYRVESVEPLTASRTIGYIRPGEVDEIAARVGRVVGIHGRSAMDPELRMVIIEPEEIEVLNAAP